MMKKVFLSLFLAIVCLPVAFGQAFDNRPIITTSETTCGSYVWSVTGDTLTHDTTILAITDTAIYVLDLTVRTASGDTTQVNDSAACVYIWNDSIWKTPGYHIGILTDVNGCDSVVRVNLHLTLVDSSSIDTVVCDSVLAPWGEMLTESLSCDSTWTTGEGCQRHDVVNLVVGHSFLSPIEEVEADCIYLWNGQSITDTAVHSYTRYTNVGHCDSTYRIRVNFSYHIIDSTVVSKCGQYTWNVTGNTYDSTGTYTHETTNGNCVTTKILALTISPIYSDTTDMPVRDVTAGCFYKWGDSTFTDTNVIHVATVKSTDGCDSIGAIRIIAYTNIEEETIDTVYCGDVFTWVGRQVADSGSYDTTTVANGCTTNHHLILAKTYHYDTLAEVKRCASYTTSFDSRTGDGFSRYSVTFTTSGLHVTDPNYDDPLFPDQNLYSKEYGTGCITFHALPLTIVTPEQRVRPDVDTVVCDTLVFKVGTSNWAVTSTFTEDVDTTIVVQRHASVQSCFDSIVHLTLEIHHRTNVDTNVMACDSFYWDFTEATYKTTSVISKIDTSRTNDEGCYYYGRLNLTINYAPNVTIGGDWMLEPGQSTTLHAITNATNLQHKWYKDNETTPFSTDTVVTIDDPQNGHNLTVHLVSNVINQECLTTNWLTITYNNLGVEEADGVAVDIYPNPATRIVNLSSATALSQVTVYNALGQQVLVDNNGGNAVQLDLGRLAAGTYTMRISATDGSQTTRKLIVNK